MRFTAKRSFWVPALAVWLLVGVAISIWVGSITYQKLAAAATSAVPQRTGSTAPADIPSDFPYYPGGHVAESIKGGVIPSLEGIVFTSADPPSKVYDFYHQALRQGAWQVSSSVHLPPIYTLSFKHVTGRLLLCSMTIEPAKTGRGTIAIFEWAAGQSG